METFTEKLLRWAIITGIVMALLGCAIFVVSKIDPIGRIQHMGHTYITYHDKGIVHDPDCVKCAMKNSPFFKKHTTEPTDE